MICWATWSPRPGRELEAKPALMDSFERGEQMRLMKRNKKTTAILTVALLTVAGGAYGYWTTTGSGSGSAATGTVVGVTVNQTSLVTGLYPGGPAQSITGTFNNSNSGAVYVTAVTAVLGTLPSGCVPADFTIAGTAPVNANIASGSGVGTWTGLTIAMNNTPVSQDGCKSATIPLVLASS